jgi:hypothetical protein
MKCDAFESSIGKDVEKDEEEGEEEDIHVDDDDEEEDEESPINGNAMESSSPNKSTAASSSIFSVSSLLADSPPRNSPTPPHPANAASRNPDNREKDEITPADLASRPFFYPALTLDMLNRQRNQPGGSEPVITQAYNSDKVRIVKMLFLSFSFFRDLLIRALARGPFRLFPLFSLRFHPWLL